MQIFQKQQENQYGQYASDMKRIVSDSHMAAQETALSTLLMFMEYAPVNICQRTLKDVLPAVVEKCFSSSRASTKTKSQEVFLKTVEVLEHGDLAMETLLEATLGKLPKLVVHAVNTIKQVVFDFGVKTVNIKSLLKQQQRLFGHGDKNVRMEATNLAVVLYGYMGEGIWSYLSDLKDLQQKELRDLFSKQQKLQPQRLTRSQRTVVPEEKMEEEEQEDVEMVQEQLDFHEPEEVLSKIPQSFYEGIQSQAWKERVAAIENLLPLIQKPRLQQGRYNELISLLSKRINEVNMNVSALSMQAIEALALGLKTDFAVYRNLVISALLERSKEKRASIVDPLRKALDAVFLSTSLESNMEDIAAASMHKNPQVRLETLRFLKRCLCFTTQITKQDQKTLLQILEKGIEDGFNDVRDTSAECIGTLMKLLGEKAVSILFDKLDSIKQTKIREFCNEAKVKGLKQKKIVSVPQQQPQVQQQQQTLERKKKKVIERKTERIDFALLPGEAKQKQKRALEDKGMHKWSLDLREPQLEFLKEQASTCFTTPLVNLLFSSGHQRDRDHLDAMNKILEFLKQGSMDCWFHADVILKYLTIRMQDTNTTIVLKCMDMLELLTTIMEQNSKNLSDYEANVFIPSLILKFGDKQIAKRAKLISSRFQSLYPLQKILSFLFRALESKNQRIKAEVLDEIGDICLKGETPKQMPLVASFILERDANLRNSAINACVKLARVIGVDQMYKSLGKIPEKSKFMLEQKTKKLEEYEEPMEIIPIVTEFSEKYDKEMLITHVLNAISSLDCNESVEAIRQVEKLLQNQPILLEKHVDELTTICLLKIQHCFYLEESYIQTRLCRHLVNVLMDLFQNQISKHLSCQVMLDLIRCLLSLMLDPILCSKLNGPSLVKALNMVMVRVLERTEPNKIFSVLFKLLTDSMVNLQETQQIKFAELSMKCLWKVIRLLNQYITENSLNVSLLIQDIHSFLIFLHLANLRESPLKDIPIRTIKTILSELVNVYKEQILEYFDLVQDTESYCLLYTKQLLQSLKKQPPFQALDLIFNKISSKNQSKEGILDLYEFQKLHPELQNLIQSKIQETGTYFQSYIKRNLDSLQDSSSQTSQTVNHLRERLAYMKQQKH